MCVTWQLVRHIFLGKLREAEVERLNEQAWREVVEILWAITIFRQDLTVVSLAMVTGLIMIKALHWLAQKRVEYVEMTPFVSLLFHARIVSFMMFLLVVDCCLLWSYADSMLKSWPASFAIFFTFEYTILVSSTISTILKYTFHVFDNYMEGRWEKKAAFTFYLELIRDLFHLTAYFCYFFVICSNYNPPLHLIRELYDTFRNFRARLADYIRYRKITSNMDERFPTATPEEINTGDATCIICREEMTTAKKLPCGHIFHEHCLKSWLERQNTCPTCRASVESRDNSLSTSHSHAGITENAASTSNSQNAAGDNFLNPHQARLKAASLAASIYGKSFISHTNTFFGSSANINQTQLSTDMMKIQIENLKKEIEDLKRQTEEELQKRKELQEQLETYMQKAQQRSLVDDPKGKAIAASL